MGHGSHVGFPISAKNKNRQKHSNLVYDHPMKISAKFDSNGLVFCGFSCFVVGPWQPKKDENDENVKFP